jgi:CDP-diacylglycerol--serine O-phosphatidyltransferase
VKSKKAIFPNIVTTLNILSGFMALAFASDGHYVISAYFIFLAAIFDLLDGIVARLLKTSSDYGVQLDSLSDTISFGAAPALLMYNVALQEYGLLGILISSLLLIFGILRLARFNTQIESLEVKSDFKGLPIPLSALTIASYILMFPKDGIPTEPLNLLVIPLIVILSLMMVSNVPYSAFPKLKMAAIKENPVMLLFILYSFAVLYFTRNYGLFIVFSTLIIFGILKYIYLKFTGDKEDEEVNFENNISEK